MKKEDLRTGDVVQYRDGQYRKVMLNTGVSCFENIVVASNGGGYLHLEQLERYLDKHSGEDIDIVKIFRPMAKNDIFSFDTNRMELIWEFKKPRIFDAELLIREEGFDYYISNRTWIDKCHGGEVKNNMCNGFIVKNIWTREENK